MNFNDSKYPMIVYFLYDNLRLYRNYFFCRTPLRRNGEELSCIPFFIIGSGRSGTTLLMAILTSHPDLFVSPESKVMGRLVRSCQSLNFLPWRQLSRLIVSQFEARRKFDLWQVNVAGFYDELLSLRKRERSLAKALDMFYCYCGRQKKGEFRMWGDKSPLNTLNLGWIHEVFPQAKFIHIIRDGRDVVSSMLIKGDTPAGRDIEIACRRWNQSIELAQRFGKMKGKQYVELRYEELVSHPELAVKRICQFLSVDYQPGMLHHQARQELLLTKLKHHRNVRKPVNPDSIGKWKNRLNVRQKHLVNSLLHHNLVKLGYQ